MIVPTWHTITCTFVLTFHTYALKLYSLFIKIYSDLVKRRDLTVILAVHRNVINLNSLLIKINSIFHELALCDFLNIARSFYFHMIVCFFQFNNLIWKSFFPICAIILINYYFILHFIAYRDYNLSYVIRSFRV